MQGFASTDIVIPICNEEETVSELVRRLRQTCPGAELIFVDNASTDRTCELLAREEGVRLIRHERNLGYGRSLIDGIRAGSGEFVAIIDADLEYQPEDVPAILAGLQSSEAVYGSRFKSGGGRPVDMSGTRRFGNRLVTGFFNLLFGQSLTDLYTGIRGFRRNALSDSYRRDGFEFVLEVSADLAKRGKTIAETPAEYRPRSSGRSKMRHLPELLKFGFWLLRFRLER